MQRLPVALLLALAAWLIPTPSCARPLLPPNVVFIYADDLGWGDLSCYGARAFKTPNIDRLARQGRRFTDAHAASATCTPSRYALMTGEYPWRRKGTGVLAGDAALILQPGRPTLPSIFQQAGYRTGVVGKWHLGLGTNNIDWNTRVSPGPNDVGFDYSFIMAATADRVPCVYLENQRVVNLDPADPIQVNYAKPIGTEPTGRTRPDLLRIHPSHGHDMTIVNGISRIGYMSGGHSAWWKDETMADVFTGAAVHFLETQRANRFFLYFALHDPHVPRAPNPRFVGKSRLGPRGDAILQADASVGRILDTLERLGLDRETLVVFTSDNGAVVDDGYKDEAVTRLGTHRPNGPWRGGKYSKFEAGTRVPLIARWPGKVRLGVSDALFSQVDFLTSFSALLGRPLPAGASPDGLDALDALLGETESGRTELVEHSAGLALRKGTWKFIPAHEGPRYNAPTDTELGNDKVPQLYDLRSDPGETNNLAKREPGRVAEMEARLEAIRAGTLRPAQ